MFSNAITITPSPSGYAGTVFTFEGLATPANRIDNVLWDFGDGTSSALLSSNHAYAHAGVYGVEYTICTDTGVSYATSQELSVFDYITDNIAVSSAATDVYTGETIWFTVSATASNDFEPIVDLAVQGSKSAPYAADPLRPQWRFVNSDSQPVTSIELEYDEIEVNSTVIGFSGNALVGVIDDMPGDISVIFTLRPADQFTNSGLFSSAEITVNPRQVAAINVTHDGETDFKAIQWVGVDIPFAAVLVASGGEPIFYGNHDVVLQASATEGEVQTFSASFDSYSLCSGGGYYQGTLSTCASATNVIFTCTATDNVLVSTFELSTNAAEFDIIEFYDHNAFSVVNENVNFVDVLKQYAPQKFVEMNPAFYDFLTAIFGNGGFEAYEQVGLKTNTLIENMVAYLGDVDTCTVAALKDKFAKLGNETRDYNVQVPVDFNRILHMLSIAYSNLLGTSTNARKIECGLDIINDIVFAGEVLNAYDLISQTTQEIHVVPISSVSSYTMDEIQDYHPYDLRTPFASNYTFRRTTTETQRGSSLIDWDNCYTVLPDPTYSQWIALNGSMDQIIEYYLLKGMELNSTSCSAVTIDCNQDDCV